MGHTTRAERDARNCSGLTLPRKRAHTVADMSRSSSAVAELNLLWPRWFFGLCYEDWAPKGHKIAENAIRTKGLKKGLIDELQTQLKSSICLEYATTARPNSYLKQVGMPTMARGAGGSVV